MHKFASFKRELLSGKEPCHEIPLNPKPYLPKPYIDPLEEEPLFVKGAPTAHAVYTRTHTHTHSKPLISLNSTLP